MQDAIKFDAPKSAGRTRANRGGILVGGTLVVLIAAGITMQVWRAQGSQAAEQQPPGADGEGQARMNAQETTFARINGEGRYAH